MGVICVRIIRVLALLLLEARYHRAGRDDKQQCRARCDAAIPRSGASGGLTADSRDGCLSACLAGRGNQPASVRPFLSDGTYEREVGRQLGTHDVELAATTVDGLHHL